VEALTKKELCKILNEKLTEEEQRKLIETKPNVVGEAQSAHQSFSDQRKKRYISEASTK
jgi:hypothetical protein